MAQFLSFLKKKSGSISVLHFVWHIMITCFTPHRFDSISWPIRTFGLKSESTVNFYFIYLGHKFKPCTNFARFHHLCFLLNLNWLVRTIKSFKDSLRINFRRHHLVSVSTHSWLLDSGGTSLHFVYLHWYYSSSYRKSQFKILSPKKIVTSR